MTLFLNRMLGASVLNGDMYEELERNPATTGEAVAVVVLASIAGSLGTGFSGDDVWMRLAVASLMSLALWLAWAMLAFQIGTRLLPEAGTHATWGELLRTTGFAATPGLLQVFGAVTPWASELFIASVLWMFAAMVLALQRALDYRRPWRAFAVAGTSAALVLLIATLASLAFASTVR